MAGAMGGPSRAAPDPGGAGLGFVGAPGPGLVPSTAGLPELRVLLVSRIENLAALVQRSFSESAIAQSHVLRVDTAAPEVIGSGAFISEHKVLLADPSLVVGVIDHCFPRLEWMQSTWAGVKAIIDKTVKRDYVLTRAAAGIFGQQMSEYLLGQILHIERGLSEMAQLQRLATWDPRPFQRTRQLTKLTLAILGPGDIGQFIAQRAKGMGMRTVALKREGTEIPGIDEVHTELPQTLARGDYIVNLLPSGPETQGMLSGDVLRHCKQGAVFVNVGRGDIVNEASLLRALENNWLSRAVLDVFPVEPLPPDSPLWGHPRVTVTPHVAALSLPEDVADLFVRNLELYARGQRMLHEVDWSHGC